MSAADTMTFPGLRRGSSVGLPSQPHHFDAQLSKTKTRKDFREAHWKTGQEGVSSAPQFPPAME